jgi:hypothetical protein
MKPWAQTNTSEYLRQNVRAHDILKDVPIHDVWRLDLPGGEGRTIADIRALTKSGQASFAVQFLFAFRKLLGRYLGWDKQPVTKEGLFINHLSPEDRDRSLIASGTKDGPFTVLYVYPNEALSEIRNTTVHAALVWVLLPRERGYRMLWAIYVKPVSRFTAFYMFLIGPFRRWIVYPSLLRRLYKAWCQKYPN